MKSYMFITMLILSVFGIVFISLVFHEIFHVIHAGTAESLCYNFNAGLKGKTPLMYVVYDPKTFPDVAVFQKWDALDEKMAYIAQYILLTGLAVFLGFTIGRKAKR